MQHEVGLYSKPVNQVQYVADCLSMCCASIRCTVAETRDALSELCDVWLQNTSLSVGLVELHVNPHIYLSLPRFYLCYRCGLTLLGTSIRQAASTN